MDYIDKGITDLFDFGILGLLCLILLTSVVFLVKFIMRLLQEMKTMVNNFNETINKFIKAEERNTTVVTEVKNMVSKLMDKM
jgi:hypothetical protein